MSEKRHVVKVSIVGDEYTIRSDVSPEQTRGEEVTQATDVWALGLLAFYVLTGRNFWLASARSDDQTAVMREIDQPVPIASIRALELGASGRIPKGFDEWFAQSVAHRPNERFVSAAAAYAALSNALAG